MKEQAINILNALLTISTKGEDTITMAQCLQGMHYLINLLPEETQNKTEQEEG